MTKTIIPRGQWVLVKPLKDTNRETEQGLLIPASEEKEQKAQGTVEAVGADIKNLEKGQVVIYGAYAGEVLQTREDGKEVEYRLLLDEDIIAFIQE